MKKLMLSLLVLPLLCLVCGTRSAGAQPNVNNFYINTYSIDYTLGRTTDNHSTLLTKETIDATFPDYDQNHGIERSVPETYDGRTTGLHISSVTDGSGNKLQYTTYGMNGNLVIRIGDANKYVHGLQRYVITYTQQDVTKYFANTDGDEFYWDTNGTDWAVPINELAVTLHVDPSLRNAETGKQSCYQGSSGSSDGCAITPTDDGFSLEVSGLEPGQNATMAIGFKPHTFAGYTMSLKDKIIAGWLIWTAVSIPLGLLFIGWLVFHYFRWSNRQPDHTSIIPEYQPPKDCSVTLAAAIYRNARSIFSAQLLDLAIRGYLKLFQTSEKSLFKRAEYEIQIVRDVSDLKAEEKELLSDIFSSLDVGTMLVLSTLRKNTTVYNNISDNDSKLYQNIKGFYGLRARNPQQTAWFKRIAARCLILGLVTVSPALLICALAALVCGLKLYPLTDKGLELFHYLEGLKMYINVAEKDRIRMLQTPEAAEKIGMYVDTNDARQMIKLYEPVLPYAVLFGLDKKWGQALGNYYDSLKAAPEWYAGNYSTFNAFSLGSFVGSFTNAAVYSPQSSSGSGGSFGGGSSGGGGGGGGGGGW